MIPPIVMIGKKIRIFWKGTWLECEVIDETKNTLVVKSKNRERSIIPKRGCLIEYNGRIYDGVWLLDMYRRASLVKKKRR
ncbi:MAG: hypothetical protein QXL15_01160 [Candidatus Korarchaeota archaeon]